MKRDRTNSPVPAGPHDHLDLLFGPRCHLDSFPAFYSDTLKRSGLGGIDELSSAWRLYLFLGELKNRR